MLQNLLVLQNLYTKPTRAAKPLRAEARAAKPHFVAKSGPGNSAGIEAVTLDTGSNLASMR